MRITEIITEARRNPELNRQRVGLASVLEYLKTLSPEQLARTYVSGQDVNKLGINYSDPTILYDDEKTHVPGIWAWPATYFLKTGGNPMFFSSEDTADAGRNRLYKHIFELDPAVVSKDINKVDSIVKSVTGDNTGSSEINYKANKALRSAGIGAVQLQPRQESTIISMDPGSTLILSSSYIRNQRTFVDRPEHLGPEEDWNNWSHRTEGTIEKLIQLAKHQPLTPQQEQALIRADSENQDSYVEFKYLPLLKKQQREPSDIIKQYISQRSALRATQSDINSM